MFTGLIETVGKIVGVRGQKGNRVLAIAAGFAGELAVGESVAVNGVCLTVTGHEGRTFEVEAVGATLKTTTLARLGPGSRVNLERALRLGDRVGGHMVQGHVDEVGRVKRVEQHPGYRSLAVEVKRESSGLLAAKGSVCVDGVSLTAASARPSEFSVNIIPHTCEATTLGLLHAGERVNIEYDMLVKAAQASR